MPRASRKRCAFLFVIVGLFATSVGAPHTSRAQDSTWVEAKLVSYDEMAILYTLAEALLQNGKIEGARAALLASGDALLLALPKAHMPAARTQLERYDKISAEAYQGFEFKGDEKAFKALIAEHEPTLVDLADRVSLPPVGKRFKNPLERVQRVLQASDTMEEATTAAKTYAGLAPNLEVHVPLKEAKKVYGALRQILFAAVALNDHKILAIESATEQAKLFETKTDTAIKAENLGMILHWADQETEYAGYLEKLEQPELAKKHLEHAKAALEKEHEIREAQIAANRLPADNYKGKDAKKMRKLAKKQVEAVFPKYKVLKVHLNGSEFSERWELVDLGEDVWAWRRIRRYQWAYVVYQKGDGDKNCSVYPVRIEQSSSGSGYGDYYTYKPLHIYGFTMLVENIDL